MPQSVDATLIDRGADYGPYNVMAERAQIIKAAIHSGRNWNGLPPEMKESLDLIATKIARILTGNPYNPDSWHDIEGYAKLVWGMLDSGETS